MPKAKNERTYHRRSLEERIAALEAEMAALQATVSSV